jgi:nucleoside-diphosphate-sugar epimerase
MLGRALYQQLLCHTSLRYNVVLLGHTWFHANHWSTSCAPVDANADVTEPKIVCLQRLAPLTYCLEAQHTAIIVHCTAEQLPGAFDNDPEEAMTLNVESTVHVAQECRELSRTAAAPSEEQGDDAGSSSRVAGPHLVTPPPAMSSFSIQNL